jgi:peptidoglycan/xylan/chitin deacetylase (PgdA/CDA1 family)
MIIKGATALLAPGGSKARLSILVYHRVLPKSDPLLPDQITIDEFNVQMQALSEHFRVLPLEEALQCLRQGNLPSKAACVTFDDGYADNVECALPILQSHGVRATFFVATGFLDGGMMWNDTVIEAVRRFTGDVLDLGYCGLGCYAAQTTEQRQGAIESLLQRLKYLEPEERSDKVLAIAECADAHLPDNLMMTSEQLRLLHSAGMGIGAHTVHHPILTRVIRDVARDEIAGSKDALERIISVPVRLFAYPNGVPDRDYNIDHVRLVRELGFSAAVSTAWGVANAGAEFYQLPRFTPWRKTARGFVAQLLLNCLRTNPKNVQP